MSEVSNPPVPTIVISKNQQPVKKLALIQNLLDELHNLNITYCHWKSNEHLDASMTADTDLDILFDESEKEKLLTLFNRLGFKKFDAISQRQYKDIEDYIGLDVSSGRIIHLHTHFMLTMGEAYLKSYQLNLEQKILESRVYDETFGIYRSHPAFELILLYFRQALKIRNRDVIDMYLKNKVNYTGNILREYNWLKQRCTNEEVEAILKSIFENHLPIYKLVIGAFNRKQLHKLSGLIKKEFKEHKLTSPIKALVSRWYREVSISIFKRTARISNQPIIAQRINPRGGLVVAIIGADGSGKSTVIANLEATFKKKLDVYRIYMGKGKASAASWPRKVLLRFRKKRVLPVIKHNKNAEILTAKNKKVAKLNLFRCLEGLIVISEKRLKLRLMQAAKTKGMLVICDRFPQNQIMGFNDGPVLHQLTHSSNPLSRAIAKAEKQVCDAAASNPPDIVFKLVADAKVIEARKPSLASLAMLEAKVEGIKKLSFANGCRVITVDATQPLEDVLCTIKKEIWQAYL